MSSTNDSRDEIKIAKELDAQHTPASLPPSEKPSEEAAPRNHLWVVIPCILFSIFLPALDQTITAVALPTIINDIGGQAGYSWIGAAYLLASASCSPFYGKFSDILGRKPVLVATWLLFLLGSALCGAAHNITWLAICRGIQGAGGGGVITLCMIAISDITPLARRGLYIGLVGTVWGAASVIGPTIGGVLTDRVSWRWCFYINLPIGGALLLALCVLLRLKPSPRRTIQETLSNFDFIGLFLAVAGTACLLVGLELGKSDWSQPSTIVLIVLGGILGLGCAINEFFTKKSPIIPPRLFSTPTTAAVLCGASLHGFAVFAGSYYIPVYFQIIGLSPTDSGVRTMGFSVVSSVAGSVAGFVTTTRVGYRPVIWISWAVATAGYGLMIMLSDTTPTGLQELYIIVAGLGVGGLFQVPLIALHAAMPHSEMATSSAAFMLLRLIGSAVGVSAGDTIFSSEARRKVLTIPGYVPSGDIVTDNFHSLQDIKPDALRHAVVHAYTLSLSTIWIVVTALVGCGLLLSAFIASYSLHRHSPAPPAEDSVSSTSEQEKGLGQETSGPFVEKVANDSGSNEPR